MVPPPVGVAVNVTDSPEQMLVLEATTDTEAAIALLTVMVTTFDVAGEPLTQLALEVITTDT